MAKASHENLEKLDQHKKIVPLIEEALESAARETKFGADKIDLQLDWMRIAVRENSTEFAIARNLGIVIEPDLELNWGTGLIEITMLKPREGLEKIFLPALRRELEVRKLQAQIAPVSLSEKKGGKIEQSQVGRQPKEYLVERHKIVMATAGKTAEEIAEVLEKKGIKGISTATVNRDLKLLGLVQKRKTRKYKNKKRNDK